MFGLDFLVNKTIGNEEAHLLVRVFADEKITYLETPKESTENL